MLIIYEALLTRTRAADLVLSKVPGVAAPPRAPHLPTGVGEATRRVGGVEGGGERKYACVDDMQ